MQRGKQWLKSEFNYAPRAALSLEHNGNSDTNARLMGESGAEALFIRYIDPQDRDMRLQTNTMEFVWRPDFYHSGNRDQIFTHIIYDFDMSVFDLVFDSNPYQNPDSDDQDNDNDEGDNTDD
jgi:hypothetical protein